MTPGYLLSMNGVLAVAFSAAGVRSMTAPSEQQHRAAGMVDNYIGNGAEHDITQPSALIGRETP